MKVPYPNMVILLLVMFVSLKEIIFSEKMEKITMIIPIINISPPINFILNFLCFYPPQSVLENPAMSLPGLDGSQLPPPPPGTPPHLVV